MSPHFEPKREDGRAVWRVIFDEIADRIKSSKLKVNDVVAHSELRKLLKGAEQAQYYTAVGRANIELGKVLHRSLQSARSAGYRLTAGAGQVEFGQSYKKRGLRNFKKGLTLIKTADRSMMTAADRSWADKVEAGMVTLATITAMNHERLMEHDKMLKELRSETITNKQATTATQDEIAELRRRIDEMAAVKVS